MKFKLLTQKDKVSADGTGKVVLIHYAGGKELRWFTGLRCPIAKDTEGKLRYWNERAGEFRKTFDGWQTKNEALTLLSRRFDQYLDQCAGQSVTPSQAGLNAFLEPEAPGPGQAPAPLEESKEDLRVVTLFDRMGRAARAEGKKTHTWEKYQTLARHLKAWRPGLLLEELTDVAWQRFLIHMKKGRAYHPNTIWTWEKALKTFFDFCDGLGLALPEGRPQMRARYIQPERIHLTELELEAMAKLELTGSLDEVRDCFLFACSVSPRDSDLRRLTKDHIVDYGTYRTVRFTAEKTSSYRQRREKTVEVPLTELAEALIAKWAGRGLKTLLPVHSNPDTNRKLKVIARMAGLTQRVDHTEYDKEGKPKTVRVPKYSLVTIHGARHSFAVLCLKRGVPFEVVMGLMGHSKAETTRIYARLAKTDEHELFLNKFQGK